MRRSRKPLLGVFLSRGFESLPLRSTGRMDDGDAVRHRWQPTAHDPSRVRTSPRSSSTVGSSIVAGMRHSSPSAILRIVPRRILPERVFGSALTMRTCLKDATGPISSRTRATSSAAIVRALTLDPRLQDGEADRHLTLEIIGDPDDRALGDIRVGGEHLLHRAGRKPVAGGVDDVVGPAHDVDVAVVVDVARVGGHVVAVVAATGRRRPNADRHPTAWGCNRAAGAA